MKILSKLKEIFQKRIRRMQEMYGENYSSSLLEKHMNPRHKANKTKKKKRKMAQHSQRINRK